jgi:transposase
MMEWKRNGREEGKVADAPVEGAVGDRSRGIGGRAAPDPELMEHPRRRTFTAAYKLRIVREADACERPGEVGALLRREGLYSSHLTAWRKQRDQGALQALSKPRGRPKPDPRDAQIERLLRRSERAEAELATARKVIEVQGNVSALLEELLKAGGAKQNGSSEW